MGFDLSTDNRCALVDIPIPAESSLGWLFVGDMEIWGYDCGWTNSIEGSTSPIAPRGPQWLCGEGCWWSGLSPSLAAAFPHPACKCCGFWRVLPCPSYSQAIGKVHAGTAAAIRGQRGGLCWEGCWPGPLRRLARPGRAWGPSPCQV